MIPTAAFTAQINNLVATDTTWLANASPNTVALVIAPFTPAPTLQASDLTLASFTGGDPKSITAGNQTKIFDSTTGRRGILLVEPAGGLNFVCTGLTGLPQTVYGYALLKADGTLIATALLDTPQTIVAVGNNVLINATFGFLQYIPYTDL